jgi:hypothetical protein
MPLLNSAVYEGDGLRNIDRVRSTVGDDGRPWSDAMAVDEVVRMCSEMQEIVMRCGAYIPEPVSRSLYLLTMAVLNLATVVRPLIPPAQDAAP